MIGGLNDSVWSSVFNADAIGGVGVGLDQTQQFTIADVDGDGGLSAQEVSAIAPTEEVGESLFAALDADGDGAVTQAEGAEFLASMRDRMAEAMGSLFGAFMNGSAVSADDYAFDISEYLDPLLETEEDEAEDGGGAADPNRLANMLAERAYSSASAWLA